MSKNVLKLLKELAESKGLEFKKNAGEKKMKEVLDKAEVGYEHLYKSNRSETEEPTQNKRQRDEQEECKVQAEKQGRLYLGDCVKTGKPLYADLK